MQDGQNNNQVEKKSNPFSVTALVLGLLAIVGSFIPIINYVTWLLGILAIVFGAIGMKKSNETKSGHGLAVAGLVLGIISTAFGVIAVICVAACASAADSCVAAMSEGLDEESIKMVILSIFRR